MTAIYLIEFPQSDDPRAIPVKDDVALIHRQVMNEVDELTEDGNEHTPLLNGFPVSGIYESLLAMRIGADVLTLQDSAGMAVLKVYKTLLVED